MKAKHLKIPAHTQLYKSLLQEIKSSIRFDSKKLRRYFSLKALFYVSLAVAAYYLILASQSLFLFLTAYVGFGLLAVLMCFNFAHDLSHNALFKKARWNNFFFEVIYTLVGAHPSAWKDRHLQSHHFAPNVKHFDTDLAITGLIRVLPTSDKKWYHSLQHLYAPLAYMGYSLYWVFMKDFLVLRQFAPKKYKAKYYLIFVLQKALYFGYLLGVPMLFAEHNVGWVLLGFLLMHMIQSLYTLFTFFITHHVEGAEYPDCDENGLIETSWFMNQIRSSNDFYPFSHVANFIFGGVNNHIAHHLFPTINHYYYPEVNKILYRRLAEMEVIPNQTTYLGGVKSHLLHLKGCG